MKSKALEQIPGILHGFGTRAEPIPNAMLPYWKFRPEWKQVHGTATCEIIQPQNPCGEVDALWTRHARIPVAVVTADCVPILICHQSGLVVASIHAGWRGTVARITEKIWKDLSRFDQNPQSWVASIGPSIGPCCYEVSEELAQQFKDEFSDLESRIVVPRPRILDLGAIHQAILERIGFGEIDLMRKCTHCTPGPEGNGLFFSYRRGDRSQRQFSVIMTTSRGSLER